MAGLGCKWAWLIEELLFNSSLEHMFCHTVTSRVSPTDFRFYVLDWQHDPPYGGGGGEYCLCSIIGPFLLNQWIINRICCCVDDGEGDKLLS